MEKLQGKYCFTSAGGAADQGGAGNGQTPMANVIKPLYPSGKLLHLVEVGGLRTVFWHCWEGHKKWLFRSLFKGVVVVVIGELLVEKIKTNQYPFPI